MSGIVEQAEHQQRLDDYNEYLAKLVEYGDIEGDAAGITKAVIANGIESLSAKQRYLFDKQVGEPFAQPQCEQCEELIPWDEAYEHIHEQSLCSGCQHTYDRFMED